MPRRNNYWASPPRSSAPSAVLIGLALTATVLLLWTWNRASSNPVLAAAPLSPRPGRAASLPLLSSVVALNAASDTRTPIQLTGIGMASTHSAAALPTNPAARKALCLHALAQLLDDDIRGNATLAMRQLRALDSTNDPELRPLLVACLKSRDLQQRSLIASFLNARSQAPEQEMLLAAAQDLRDDVVPRPHKSLTFQGYPEGWTTDDRLGLPSTIHNASQAAALLLREGERAWPHLLKGLNASDPQQRFLSAVILARTGCEQDLRFTITILVTHLKDNDWKGDATIAGRALHSLGQKALPQLRKLQGISDAQASRLVKLAILEIEEPSRNAREAYDRARRIAPGPNRHPLAVWRFTPDSLDGLIWR